MEDLQYLWKSIEPVQIVPDLHLPRFTLEKYISDYCNIKTNTGKLMRKWIEHCIQCILLYPRRVQLPHRGLDLQT